MTRPYRFRTLFYRQWLNSVGIPLVGATLLLVSFPYALTVLALALTVALFLLLALAFRQKEKGERSVTFLLASVGICLAVLTFSAGMKQVETAERCFGADGVAEGYVVYKEDGKADLSLISLNGKLSFRKLRLDAEENVTVGSRLAVSFTAARSLEDTDLQDGVFLSGKMTEFEETGKSYLFSFIGSLRSTFSEKLGEGREGAFLKAILLGDRSDLAKSDENAFRKTASSHLLAISGLHITVLVGMAYLLMDVFRTPRPWKKAILFPLVLFLCLITGGSVSVFRASFMTLFSASAYFLKQRGDSVTALTLAASLITLQNPFAVASLSFLFSFTSTFAIVTVASPLATAASEWMRPLLDRKGTRKLYSAAICIFTSVLVAAPVFLFSLPLNLLIFGEVQVLSPVYSVFLIPLFSPCLTVGVVLLLLFLLPISLPWVTQAAYFLIRLFLDLVAWMDAAAPELVNFGDFAVPAALFLCALLVLFMRFRRKLREFLLLYAALTAALLPLMAL